MIPENLIELIVQNLEEVSREGRPTWEKLAAAIAASPEADEIQSWLSDIGDGQI